MSTRLTARGRATAATAERELEKPGLCTRCGHFEEYRNTAGQCGDCHNAGYYEWQARRKVQLADAAASGRAYWAAIGVKPGDRVERKTVGGSIFGCHEVTLHGMAKVGAAGAYVHTYRDAAMYSPEGWRKCAST